MMAYIPVAQNTPGSKPMNSICRKRLYSSSMFWVAKGSDSGLEDMASNSVKIVKAARAKSRSCSRAMHIFLALIRIELWGEHGIVGSDAAQPLADFDVQESDFVISKRRYDGFYQTDLDLTLRELGVDTLIAVGCDTNICVLQTLAGAYFRGYKTIVPADATATFLVGTQEGGLEYFTRCYDSRVTTTESVLEKLQ